jgi:hypothetical protein
MATATLTATPLGAREPTPTPEPNPCTRTYINVVVWGRVPVSVDLYVAGTRYASQMTSANSAGEQQATFIVWPGENEYWDIRIEPHLPAGLDPTQWGFVNPGSPWQFSVARCMDMQTTVQLVSLSELGETLTPTPGGEPLAPTPAATLAVSQLPVTGAAANGSLLRSIWLLSLGLMFVSAGGVLRLSSRER